MKIHLRVHKSPTEAFEWEHTGSPLRIGRADDCQLSFQGSAAETVSGRHVQIDVSPGGASVSDLGSTNGTYLNGARLAEPAELRSGDSLQLGRGGPRIDVLMIELPVTGEVASADMGDGSAAPRRTRSASWRQRSESATGSPLRKWALPAVIGAAVLVCLLCAVLLMRKSGVAHDNSSLASATPSNPTAAQTTGTTNQSVDRKITSNSEVAPATSVRKARDVPRKNAVDPEVAVTFSGRTDSAPAATAGDSHAKGVFLLVVEEPKTASRWPFGTAAAIAERTLLTSATVVMGLANFREQGWKVSAINQRLGLNDEVTDLRVHAGFAAQAKPEKQIYADLGLVTVISSLPNLLQLASRDELADLDRGVPITCLGYLYENEPIGRFHTFLPERHAGKIFIITSLPPSPGGPRLMHIRAELPGKMYGAPIVSATGHVLGVFSETAAPPSGQPSADLHLHYAPVTDSEQIDRWIKNRDEQWWVQPVASTAPRPEKN